AACGSSPTALPAVHITEFRASAAQVEAGQSVILTWATEGASKVTLETQDGSPVPDAQGLSGQVTVAPSRTSVYLLTAVGDGGADVRAITVSVHQADTALLFAAVPLEIHSGEPVTLTWSAPGAASVQLTSNEAGNVPQTETGATGSRVVHP